jgi:predicted NACHT family NTPase
MERSRKLALTNWTLANNALVLRFAGNKSELTKSIKMSRTTVTAFFNSKPIREAEFRKICFALLLNWQEISSVSTDSERKNDNSLEQVRSHCREKILQNYSKIRLLSGQEIGVDQLYVDVWLLNRQPRTFQVSESKMLESFDLRNDRLGLGDRIKRNDGFDVANTESKLLILGKPGAGKTTFLKHLAVDWCNGKFQPNLIAVFIEFRQIRDEKWQLLNAIEEELNIYDTAQVEALLKNGKLLLLMDGFDEVPTQELRQEVQKQLGKVAKEYSKSRYIMTCRTQIIQGIPDGFASVEVADFNVNQAQAFVRNWFWANYQSEIEVEAQWRNFELAIDKNPSLKELTVTPVLLGLMCLVLQDEGGIPAQAGLLYERGIRLLLRKWNDAKAIDGWEIGTAAYQRLDVMQKENMLVEIAARKFENPKNFVLFEQSDLIEQIARHLQLSSHDDARAVLRAIEAQHGLLVERADELWSFSHLTFQEYFTTTWLLSLSPKELSKKTADKVWQEIVQQLVKAQGQSDRLLRLIKKAIDYSIINDHQLQEFLVQILKKSKSITEPYKKSAIRAFYFALIRERGNIRANGRDLERDLDRTLEIDRARVFTVDQVLVRDILRALDHAFSDRAVDCNRARDLALALDFDRDMVLDPEFVNKLFQLKAQLLQGSRVDDFQGYVKEYGLQGWWEENAQEWREELRRTVLRYRNIDLDWQFTNEQGQKLQQYHEANRFLIKLLKIENAVSPEARKEIEDNLLLPIAELKRRLPDQYGGIEN